MTKEQEAIENLENLSEYGLCYTINEKIQEDIETVLNMLKEKDAEIEKKDKMIDLLIDYIDTLSEYYTRAEGKNNEFCDEKCIDKNIDCYDCIKQYFERKAENERI